MKTYLECPCCGAEGAESNERGLYYDGQPLTCGCNGIVSCDAESDAYVSVDDCPCEDHLDEPSDPAQGEG